MRSYRPLKILMLASSYPRSKGDSAAIFLRHLAENLSQRGIKVHVLAPGDKEHGTRVEGDIYVHRFRYFSKCLQKLAYGSGILPNLSQNRWLWIEVPFFLAATTFSLLRLISKERPDLIHAHWVLPQGLIAVLAKCFFKTPVITTAHGGDAFAFRGGLVGWLKKLVVRTSDAWTSNTHATAAAIGCADAIPRAHIIPMGVDLDAFNSSDGRHLRRDLAPDELLVLFAGRLVKKKGVHDLLKGYSLLPSDLRDRTTLWIVGDGDERARLRQFAEELAISGKIRFWGQTSNHVLRDFYAAADLFVAPSIEDPWGDTEGQGVVLLEAFAGRCCVLATRVGGISEVVEDGRTGVLVEPGNPGQLAAAMENLLRDEQLRVKLAANAYGTVKESYDWRKVAQAFEELYSRVLQQRRRRP